jgi:aryl-alcohol dehydrogenase-like predicted oxidoreductase
MARICYARWSRRAVLEGGLLAGLGTLLPLGSRAADTNLSPTAQARLPIITKAIPSTGEKIPVMGIGTNRFREDNYTELRAVLQRMHELGGSVVDTAAGYGESEAVIGRALADLGIRKQTFIATKFNAAGAERRQETPPGSAPTGGLPPGAGPAPGGAPPHDIVYGQASFDRSLQRLQTDQVAVMFAHQLASVDPLMPLLQQLKKAGKARYIGITTSQVREHPELADTMRQYPMDFVQVDYSLGNRDAAATVFPLALERKIAIMVDVPLGGGRHSLLQEVGDRPLPPWAADIDVTSWGQLFLKYVISHPAVTCAIPGTTKLEHLVDNQLAGHGRLPDSSMRKKMEQYWDSGT